MKCFYCKGEMDNAVTTYMTELKNCIVIIKNVPCFKCSQCGEVSFSGVIAQELEENLYRLTVDNELNDIVFRFSSDTRLLIGDKVTIWGESSGFIEGETALGIKTRAPKINAVYLSLVEK